MSVLASLHGRRGGVQSKKVHAPAESEGFALAVASAMYWGKLRDSTHPDFWRRIVAEVLHAESTTQQWADNEMIAHFHGTVLCGIGQEGLQLYLQRKFKGKTPTERSALLKDFVGNIMYAYLSRCKSGRDSDSALLLASKANIDAILQSKVLGGDSGWTASEFISAEVWAACGEQAGLKDVTIKLMTLIACGGRKVEIKPICPDCNELRAQHMGDRLNVKIIACACESQEVSATNANKRTSA